MTATTQYLNEPVRTLEQAKAEYEVRLDSLPVWSKDIPILKKRIADIDAEIAARKTPKETDDA